MPMPPTHNLGPLLRDPRLRDWYQRYKEKVELEKPQPVTPNRENFNLPGYDQGTQRINDFLATTQGRTAPIAADSDFRGDQRGLMDTLRGWSDGTNSISRLEGDRLMAQAAARQRSMAASARPGEGAIARRAMMGNVGQIGVENGRATQEAMLKERLGATGMMSSLATAAREQDLGLNKFNATSELENRRTNDSAWSEAMRNQFARDEAQQRGGVSYEDIAARERMNDKNNETQRYGIDAGKTTTSDRMWNMFGTLAGAGLGFAIGGPVGAGIGAGIGKTGTDFLSGGVQGGGASRNYEHGWY